MANVVWLSLTSGLGSIAFLSWQLVTARGAQRKLESAAVSQTESVEAERQELGLLIQSQTETLEALTQDNLTLKSCAEQYQQNIINLKSDHQALQEKYGGLEQDLLAKISEAKELSESLTTEKLESGSLRRQVESIRKQQTDQTQAQDSLMRGQQQLADNNRRYQELIQSAEAEIKTIKKEKKQLERDLQQALYQVVALEQEQQLRDAQYIAQGLEHEESLCDAVSVSSQNFGEPSLPNFSH